MRNTITSAASQSRSLVMAVIIGTAFATSGASKVSAATLVQAVRQSQSHDPTPDVLNEIMRYCNACWRNARVPVDDWGDCTQQVFTRLLERIEPSKWSMLLNNDESDERREFVRAIDTIKKRSQRVRRYSEITSDCADHRNLSEARRSELLEQVEAASQAALSPRQQRIVELSASGWNIPEIATELGTTPERISDEKYKAIRKLRSHLGVDA
ncbi:MAG: sigma-70 family RNA polymerase sigma factor [Fimbriiglobus sp.]